jgi:hypothetical protein
MAAPSPQQLADLSLDLQVELSKLQRLVCGIERCLVQISRVLNGGTGEGAEWHRRLLERMGQPTPRRPAVLGASTIADLQELLRFRHLVRHLYAYELRPEPVERLRLQALALWPTVETDLEQFRQWLSAADDEAIRDGGGDRQA